MRQELCIRSRLRAALRRRSGPPSDSSPWLPVRTGPKPTFADLSDAAVRLPNTDRSLSAQLLLRNKESSLTECQFAKPFLTSAVLGCRATLTNSLSQAVVEPT